jgi:hypothetical protein
MAKPGLWDAHPELAKDPVEPPMDPYDRETLGRIDELSTFVAHQRMDPTARAADPLTGRAVRPEFVEAARIKQLTPLTPDPAAQPYEYARRKVEGGTYTGTPDLLRKPTDFRVAAPVRGPSTGDTAARRTAQMQKIQRTARSPEEAERQLERVNRNRAKRGLEPIGQAQPAPEQPVEPAEQRAQRRMELAEQAAQRATQDQAWQRQDRLRQAQERVAKAKSDEEKAAAKAEVDALKAEDAELARRASFGRALDNETAPGVDPAAYQEWRVTRDEIDRQRQLWTFWESQYETANAWMMDPENMEADEEEWNTMAAASADAMTKMVAARNAMRAAEKERQAKFDQLYTTYRLGTEIADQIGSKETPVPTEGQDSRAQDRAGKECFGSRDTLPRS